MMNAPTLLRGRATRPLPRLDAERLGFRRRGEDSLSGFLPVPVHGSGPSQ